MSPIKNTDVLQFTELKHMNHQDDVFIQLEQIKMHIYKYIQTNLYSKFCVTLILFISPQNESCLLAI